MEMSRRTVLALGAAGLGTAGLAAVGVRAAGAAPAGIGAGAATETMFLSGTDADNPVSWDFQIGSGRGSGGWRTIPVPSNWETKGFGTYTRGSSSTPNENGRYRRTFSPPASWAGRRVFLVFEGAMTDTEVFLNNRSAGARHQGAFYRFRYDVTALLTLGASNLLELTVYKDSSDPSVNRAERQGDYWNFGGIFRPVYLEAFPAARVDRLAVNARADGTLTVDAYLAGSASGRVTAQVKRLDGTNVGGSFSAAVSAGATRATLSASFSAPQTWSAETPNLYLIEVVRTNDSGTQLHGVTERFGFRTVEVRGGDGVYVNGRKVRFKGANRHTFWPTLGRASSPRLARQDILLMKDMNMNAVRMSHYPPDPYFLDLCDELGLYVLDELAGWQKSYDTGVGVPLVQAMVTRDVNHPSVVFWDNGNEGGWNTALDGEFGKWDPQGRKVLHPWASFSGIDTNHYPTYDTVASKLSGSAVYMPTEFLHGLYDGGAGAGLNDYWSLIGTSARAAGGFIWALVDEGLVRDDQGGAIDVNGNFYPDGILGPYREKEGSFAAIKEIWSPIQLASPSYYANVFPTSFNDTVNLVNRYTVLNARQCTFGWQLVTFAGPSGATGHRVTAQGTASSPDIAPGATGGVTLPLPANWRDFDALLLTVTDPAGTAVVTWVWTIKRAADHAARIVVATPGAAAATATETSTSVTLSAAGTTVTVSKSSGRLTSVTRDGTAVSLSNGPALSTGSSTLTGLTHARDGSGQVIQATYSGDMTSVRWRLDSSGWLRLDYSYHLSGSHDYFGVNFDYPEAKVRGVTWLGQGPYRVWKNRMRGVRTDVWTKQFNNTATGASGWQYPEFKGYHANTYWARLETTEVPVTVVSTQENLFLRLFTPAVGPSPQNATAPFPGGGISLLDAIPPIGNKFSAAGATGPEGQSPVAAGTYQHTVYFRFGS